MRKHNTATKLLALILTAILMLTAVPITAMAEGGGGCTHMCGDGTCAYVGGVADCDHVHDDFCGGPGQEELPTPPVTGVITAFEALPEDVRFQKGYGIEAFPATVSGIIDGQTVDIPVTWTAEGYGGFFPAAGFYAFAAQLADGYTTARGIDVPTIAFMQESMLFAAGTGNSEADPLVITNAAQLREIAALVNAGRLESFVLNDAAATIYLALGNDINLSGYGTSFNGGKGWVPIGDNATGDANSHFKGHFDGQAHVITGLYINDGTRYNLQFAK